MLVKKHKRSGTVVFSRGWKKRKTPHVRSKSVHYISPHEEMINIDEKKITKGRLIQRPLMEANHDIKCREKAHSYKGQYLNMNQNGTCNWKCGEGHVFYSSLLDIRARKYFCSMCESVDTTNYVKWNEMEVLLHIIYGKDNVRKVFAGNNIFIWDAKGDLYILSNLKFRNRFLSNGVREKIKEIRQVHQDVYDIDMSIGKNGLIGAVAGNELHYHYLDKYNTELYGELPDGFNLRKKLKSWFVNYIFVNAKYSRFRDIYYILDEGIGWSITDKFETIGVSISDVSIQCICVRSSIEYRDLFRYLSTALNDIPKHKDKIKNIDLFVALCYKEESNN